MKAHELIEELQKWPDLPVYFSYALSAETALSEDGMMVAESVSEASVKMISAGLVSDGGLITALVISGPKTTRRNGKDEQSTG